MSHESGSAPSLQEGINLHLAGQLHHAQAVYLRILELDPVDSDALHLLGVTCFHLGHHDQALPLISRAVQIDPQNHLACTNLGNVFQGLGRYDDAVIWYGAALDLAPHHADAFFNRGIAHQHLNEFQEALHNFHSALAVNPDYSGAHHHLGTAQQALGLLEESLLSFECAARSDPDNAEIHYDRGQSMQRLGRSQDALACYDRAILLLPALARAHQGRGNALHDLGRDLEAIDSYDTAVRSDNSCAEAFFQRGVTLQVLGRNEEALVSYDRALHLKADYAEAMNNRGNTCQSLQIYEEALASYLRAQNMDPDYEAPYWNEAICRLTTGDYQNGWEKYECRWGAPGEPQSHGFSQPAWRGEGNLAGQSILLHAEQGYGDTIQFGRYALLVAALGAEVTLAVPPPLLSVMGSLDRKITMRSSFDPGAYDYHCPLMSLPLAFDTRLGSVPAYQSYLTPDPMLEEGWKKVCGERSTFRIGLVWAGSMSNTADGARSLALESLTGLFPGSFDWFSLQKETSPEERELLDASGVRHFSEKLENFADTAAFIAQMDLVISVDTAVAHLAAAMGTPTWILLAHQADFRWLLGRRDSPWYPSVRLFRQASPGDWSRVIAEVSAKLLVKVDSPWA